MASSNPDQTPAPGPSLDDQVKALVDKAILQRNPAEAELLYTELILLLEKVFNKNQKEVAAALQVQSRRLESEGKVDQAFAFKQRTCAVILQLHIAERAAARKQIQPDADKP